MNTPETKTRIDEFNENVAERLHDDNFKLKEGEAIIYDDVDNVRDNNNLGYIEASDRNMNHAVGRDDHNDDEFDHLFSAELLLPTESADFNLRICDLFDLFDHGRRCKKAQINPFPD